MTNKKVTLLMVSLAVAVFISQYFGLTTKELMQSIITSFTTAVAMALIFIYILKIKQA